MIKNTHQFVHVLMFAAVLGKSYILLPYFLFRHFKLHSYTWDKVFAEMGIFNKMSEESIRTAKRKYFGISIFIFAVEDLKLGYVSFADIKIFKIEIDSENFWCWANKKRKIPLKEFFVCCSPSSSTKPTSKS